MQETTIKDDFISKEDLSELVYFETFLNRMGFKRIDGSIYGLLLLASRPLTSEEIESTLGLSQSAVSLSLKNLGHYGAVETWDSPENKRIKIHSAKEDALSIVASIFRKREGQYVEEFKLMARRILKRAQQQGNQRTQKRLQSIINTCEAAEAVMNFVISLGRLEIKEQYENILKKLPDNLETLIKLKQADGLGQLGQITQMASEGLGNRLEKLRQNIMKTGES